MEDVGGCRAAVDLLDLERSILLVVDECVATPIALFVAERPLPVEDIRRNRPIDISVTIPARQLHLDQLGGSPDGPIHEQDFLHPKRRGAVETHPRAVCPGLVTLRRASQHPVELDAATVGKLENDISCGIPTDAHLPG